MKGIIEMHRFNFCLVVVLSLSCSGVKAGLVGEIPYIFNSIQSFYNCLRCAGTQYLMAESDFLGKNIYIDFTEV